MMHIEINVPTLDFGTFQEAQHPRQGGKFAPKGGGTAQLRGPALKQHLAAGGSITVGGKQYQKKAAPVAKLKKLPVASVKKLGAAYGGTMRHRYGAKQHLAMIAEAVGRKHGEAHGAAFYHAALAAHGRTQARGPSKGMVPAHREARERIRNVIHKGTLDALGVAL